MLSQGVYAPLPQCLSDSDSDKELHEPKTTNRKKLNGLSNGSSHNGYFTPIVPSAAIASPKPNNGFMGMSTTRKCWFIISILICFFTIFIFLWVLPCSGTCPVKITNWKIEQENLEFAGKINVVQGAFDSNKNLALLFKRNIISSDSHNGVLSLLGNTGSLAWLISQVPEPAMLDCNSIDSNLDGVFDCLLLGEAGLECIDPITGEVLWHVHSHMSPEDRLIRHLDFPQILPDLNRDTIPEIIAVTTSAKGIRNKVIIASGRTGIVLTEFELKSCADVSQCTIVDGMFIYYCRNDLPPRRFSAFYKVTIDDLMHRVREQGLGVEVEIIPMQVQYDPKPLSTTTRTLNQRRLTINNIGECPNCRLNLSLIRADTLEQLWSAQFVGTYALESLAQFSFRVTRTNAQSLRGHLNGFIVKLWQYDDFRPVYRTGSWNGASNVTVQVNNIFERVVLITFNDTNVHVINASLVNITQLCFPGRPIHSSHNDSQQHQGTTRLQLKCQPDIRNQAESILIADLDRDDSQELISYSSTFECGEEGGVSVDGCQLVSSVKVIRLEAELPKLYESAK